MLEQKKSGYFNIFPPTVQHPFSIHLHILTDIYEMFVGISKALLYFTLLYFFLNFVPMSYSIFHLARKQKIWFPLLYTFFWVIPRYLNFIFRRFGTLMCSEPPLTCHSPSYWLRLFSSQTFSCINTPTFPKFNHTSHLPAYQDGTECSETSAYKIQTPGNYPQESIQHSEHGESLKSRMVFLRILNQR